MSAPLVFSVEDSDADFSLLEVALRECISTVEVLRASDGEQAMRYLQRVGPTKNAPWPNLVLLDLNLPRVKGIDILRFIKTQPLICDIPVVVFTSSSNVREMNDALALGAREFITKPLSLDSLFEVMNRVCAKYLSGVPAIDARKTPPSAAPFPRH